jgi:hypothetical protein
MLGFNPISSSPIASIDRTPVNYTFNLDKGSYSISGKSISIVANKSFNVNKGDYLIDGFNVNLQLSTNFSVNKGDYFVIGKDVYITINRQIQHGGSGGRTKASQKEYFDRLLREDDEILEITKAYLEYIL